jgi:O-acetyl-ADP-ribose deacetylase (regulator of RNase III)
MGYIEVKGNIFNSNAMAVVNTVNCVGVMGKGIALEFKLRFPEMFKEYENICFQKTLKPGQILPYKKSTPLILNFAIKDHWKDPSRIEWFENSLLEFCSLYKELGIKSVAFPWMGAMNGGIPIDSIKSVMHRYLEELEDIDIEVYEFDISATDPLFEKLKFLTDISIGELSKQSKIQTRFWIEIIQLVKNKDVNSLYELCHFKINEKRVIGKTNIERLYYYLTEVSLLNSCVYTQTQLKLL